MGYSVDEYYEEHVLPKLRQATLYDPDSDEEYMDKFIRVLQEIKIDADNMSHRSRGNDLIRIILRELLCEGELQDNMEELFNILTEDYDIEIKAMNYRKRNSMVYVNYNTDTETI